MNLKKLRERLLAKPRTMKQRLRKKKKIKKLPN